MAFYDHTYGSYPFELSSYGKNLDSVGRQTYINKLVLHPEDGEVFFISDPYFLKKEDWKYNTEHFPRVHIDNIEKYLNSTPGKNHRSRSAYDYVISGKVQDVKVFIPSGHPEYKVLSALVQPSQRCNSDPHQPWIICSENGEIINAHCTCMAGFGETCSHVFAVLYQVQLAVSLKLTDVPTQKPCQWNQRNSKKVPFAALKDITFEKVNWVPGEKKRRKIKIQSPAKIAPITAAELDDLREISPNAVLFSSLLGGDSSETDTAESENEEEDFPPTISEIISQCNVEDVNSFLPFFNSNTLRNLEIKTRCQRSKLWYKHRCGRLTASNFGEILRRKKVTPSFLEKFCTIPTEVNVPAVRWGRANEMKGFKIYENCEKAKHNEFNLRRAGLFISSTDPYLGCSPDGYISCSCCGSGVLEIKCPFNYKNVDPRSIAAMDDKFCLDTEGCMKENHPYYAQIQGQMAITNTEYCDFVIWTKKDILTTRIRRDTYFWDQNKEILKSFYFTKVLPHLQST